MRIAQLAPPVETVPPGKYGGTERVISVLTEELVRRGHQVTLFASADSQTSARLIPSIDQAIWHHPRFTESLPFMAIELDQVYRRADEFDVVHNHLDGAAFPMARAHLRPPTVTTFHGRLDLPEYQPLFSHFPELPLVSISHAQRAPVVWANWVATVHHGIALDEYQLQLQAGSYLAFLGRIAPEKGLDVAIEVARRAALPLKIAARLPLDQPHNPEAQRDWRYYREVIEPLLRDSTVEFLGELTGRAKSEFLGGAMGLLFPIRWPEPFGLVMPEALACGTPVVALRRGSVPEVIDDGLTGFIADDADGLVSAVRRLPELDRARCRAVAEARFSPAAMAEAYEQVYQRVVEMDAPVNLRHGAPYDEVGTNGVCPGLSHQALTERAQSEAREGRFASVTPLVLSPDLPGLRES